MTCVTSHNKWLFLAAPHSLKLVFLKLISTNSSYLSSYGHPTFLYLCGTGSIPIITLMLQVGQLENHSVCKKLCSNDPERLSFGRLLRDPAWPGATKSSNSSGVTPVKNGMPTPFSIYSCHFQQYHALRIPGTPTSNGLDTLSDATSNSYIGISRSKFRKVIEKLHERTEHLDIFLFSAHHSMVFYFRCSVYWWKGSVRF